MFLMQCCASCGKTEDLRLYDVLGGDHLERRWWCLECSFSARRLGLNAELAPTWIERAALHQLPIKPLASALTGPEIAGPNVSGLAILLALLHLLAPVAQPEALAAEDSDARVVDLPVRSVAADVTGLARHPMLAEPG